MGIYGSPPSVLNRPASQFLSLASCVGWRAVTHSSNWSQNHEIRSLCMGPPSVCQPGFTYPFEPAGPPPQFPLSAPPLTRLRRRTKSVGLRARVCPMADGRGFTHIGPGYLRPGMVAARLVRKLAQTD